MGNLPEELQEDLPKSSVTSSFVAGVFLKDIVQSTFWNELMQRHESIETLVNWSQILSELSFKDDTLRCIKSRILANIMMILYKKMD